MSRQRDESRPIRRLEVRLHNRRVIGGLMRDGSIAFRFQRLLPDRTIQVERIRISLEALGAMNAIARGLHKETP
jgi:hypothetical protein